MSNMDRYAYLFEMICKEYNGSNTLGKKASQKIFYFFERQGIELNLRYGIHYYGPYSSKLDDIMYELESDSYITIDTSSPTHIIRTGTEHAPETCLSQTDKKIAETVLNTFKNKSPMDLEALTTMDYIANTLLPKGASKNDIINKFIEIKGSKFSSDKVNFTFDELNSLNLICA